jgi:hypothetical protein
MTGEFSYTNKAHEARAFRPSRRQKERKRKNGRDDESAEYGEEDEEIAMYPGAVQIPGPREELNNDDCTNMNASNHPTTREIQPEANVTSAKSSPSPDASQELCEFQDPEENCAMTTKQLVTTNLIQTGTLRIPRQIQVFPLKLPLFLRMMWWISCYIVLKNKWTMKSKID